MQVIKMVAKCTSYHVIAVACPDDVTEDDLMSIDDISQLFNSD